jgi:hypothetical protein
MTVVLLAYNLMGENGLITIDSTSIWSTSKSFLIVENDTFLNNHKYNNLIYYKDSTLNKITDTYLIREDSTGKVFLSDTNEEIVAYDFSLTKGDSLILDFLGDYPSNVKLFIKIDSVGEITLNNNRVYQAQFVSICNFYKDELDCDNTFSDIWVKGIGSLRYGIICSYPFITGGSVSYLLCYFKDNELIYQNPDCNNCYQTVSSPFIKENQKQLINLYSNADGWLAINLLYENKGLLTLYSTEGKLLVKQKISSKETKICVPASGLLLYRFTTTKGENQTGKVMVQ